MQTSMNDVDIQNNDIKLTSTSVYSANKRETKAAGLNSKRTWTPLYSKDAEAAKACYTSIDQNEYRYGATGRRNYDDGFPCECDFNPDSDPLENACGAASKCINRELFVECQSTCPTGKYCQNRRMQKRQFAAVEVVKTEKKGFGLETLEDLEPGDFVIEYIGEVLPKSVFEKRTLQYAEAGHRHFYFMSLKNDEVIDAQKKGNVSRFVNHSCNPNCQLQKWLVGDQIRMGFFAIKRIKIGAELTFDYKFERYGLEAQKCYCGEPSCKGFIGADKASDELPTDRFVDPSKMSEAVFDMVKELIHAPTDKVIYQKFLWLQDVQSKDALRYFIRCHGISLLKSFLLQAKKDHSKLVLVLLEIMLHLPIAYRVSVAGDLLLNTVISVRDEDWSSDPAVSEKAAKVVTLWESLPEGYKFKKSSKSVQRASATDSVPTQSSIDSSSTKSFSSLNSGDSGYSNRSSVSGNSFAPAWTKPTGSFSFNAKAFKAPTAPLSSGSNGHPIVNDWALSSVASVLQAIAPSPVPVEQGNAFTGQPGLTAPAAKTEASVQKASAIPGLDDSFIESVVNAQRRKRAAAPAELKQEPSMDEILGQYRKVKEKKKVSSPVAPEADDIQSLSAYSKVPYFAEFKQVVGAYVVKRLTLYKSDMEKDVFKYQARKLTHLLIHKDLKRHRDLNTIELSGQLSESQKKKMKVFIQDYIKPFIQKKKGKQKL